MLRPESLLDGWTRKGETKDCNENKEGDWEMKLGMQRQDGEERAEHLEAFHEGSRDGPEVDWTGLK